MEKIPEEIYRAPLRLRALEPEDAEAVCAFENRSADEGYTERVAPLSEHSVRAYIDSLDPDPFATGQLRMLVCLKDGRPAGLLDYYDITLLHRRAMVGLIVAPELRGLGIGTRILRLACDFARRRLRLHRLGALVGERNPASLSIFRKAGFREAGRLEGWWSAADGSEETCLMLTRDIRGLQP